MNELTTTTDRRPAISPAQLERATRLAASLLEGGQHKHGKDKLAVMATAAGRAMTMTSPKEPHGQLLLRALRSADGDRPEDERAVLWLARRGTTPTVSAVAGRVVQAQSARARHQRAKDALQSIGDDEGLEAAIYVDEFTRDTGQGPLWSELARHMGWGYELRSPAITKLIRKGWLVAGTEPRSLRPGPEATGAGTVPGSSS